MKALFLDRDGTINVDYGYVHEPSRFVFFDGIFDVCRQARDHGYAIIVVTNQSGIARGYFTEEAYNTLTRHMMDAFAREGVVLTDVLHCPLLDGPDRKPNPGLFLKARDRHGIDMAASISIGDKPRDIQAAEAAGVGTNLLFTGDYSTLHIPWTDDLVPSVPHSATP